MQTRNMDRRLRRRNRRMTSQKGTAMIIAVMVMGLLAIFVAASLSRVTTEVRLAGNEKAIADSYFAAHASLEHMSLNFTQLYKRKIAPTTADIDTIGADHPPGFDALYDINQTLVAVGTPTQTTIGNGSLFAGLNATKTAWLATTEVTLKGTPGAKTRLARTFNNYTIPIFQFGIFYDGDLEFHPGPAFNFGGRVHTNGDLYLAGGALTFQSRVSTHGEVVTDRMRNGWLRDGNWTFGVSIIDGLPANHMSNLQDVAAAAGAGTTTNPLAGSVLGGPDLTGSDADRYDGTANTHWSTIAAAFRGNLLAHQDRLDLPLTRSNSSENQGPVELIKRPRGTDDDILTSSRYANKPCLRVTLSDSRAKLPGGLGGVRINGTALGAADADAVTGYKGYRPLPRTGVPTGVNPVGPAVPGVGTVATANRRFSFQFGNRRTRPMDKN